MTTAPAPSAHHVLRERFRRFAGSTADAMGSPWMFFFALVVVIGWAVSGPMFAYSDSWQLVINTGTTILTFLMVFLIQNTQNRDAKAIQLKLDELIRAVDGARTKLVRLEDMSDDELAELQGQFKRLHERLAEPQIGEPEPERAKPRVA